jgi:hypothetical protein
VSELRAEAQRGRGEGEGDEDGNGVAGEKTTKEVHRDRPEGADECAEKRERVGGGKGRESERRVEGGGVGAVGGRFRVVESQ